MNNCHALGILLSPATDFHNKNAISQAPIAYLSNSMEQSFLKSYQMHRLTRHLCPSRNLKFHCTLHKNPSQVTIPNQINPVHIWFLFLTTISILHPIYYNQSLPSRFLAKILYAFLKSPIYDMLHPSHWPQFDYINICWRVQITKLLIMQFPPASFHFFLLRSKYSPQHPVFVFSS
jgi:hypothetical protein